MKKTYEAPTVEKMEFSYRDQIVVASNGTNCGSAYINQGEYVGGSCVTPPEHVEYLK